MIDLLGSVGASHRSVHDPAGTGCRAIDLYGVRLEHMLTVLQLELQLASSKARCCADLIHGRNDKNVPQVTVSASCQRKQPWIRTSGSCLKSSACMNANLSSSSIDAMHGLFERMYTSALSASNK
jgi:hypothetical protein